MVRLMKYAALYSAILIGGISAAFCHSAHAQNVGQLISGYDYTNNKQHPANVDAQGRLQVVGSAAGGSVYGNNAIGVAPTQPPIFDGCYFNSSPGTVATGQIAGQQCDNSGRTIVVGAGAAGSSVVGNPVLTGGWDGASTRVLKTDTSGDLITIGAITSGSSTATSGLVGVAGFDGTNNRVIHTDTNGNSIVVGTVASGATDSGNPVKIGGVYNTTNPTITSGQRVDAQYTARGQVEETICDPAASGTGNCVNTGQANADGTSTANVGAYTNNRNFLFNGGSWDRAYTVQNSSLQSGVGVAAVQTYATSAVGVAINPVVSTAVESSHVLKAGGGNLYRLRVTTQSVAGYVLVFNATTAPADGAVTPQSCTIAPANTTIEIDHNIPDRYSTGITAVFSSTGCLTKTASATAFFEGFVQ